MKPEPASPPKHALDHAPTVIHDYEADETILARWLRRGLEKGPKFWALAAGSAVAIAALLAFLGGLSAGNPAQSAAWEALTAAKDPEAQVKVAEDFPKSPAAPWARLQAAGARFNEGVDKLATDRTAARPLLKQALDLFQEVEREAPKDTPLARLGALGVARSLEARNELKDAVEKYRQVASAWPGTDEARFAERQAEFLGKDEAVKFYEQLYAFKPPEKTIPPGGQGIFDNLTLPPGHPPVGPLPPLPDVPTGPIRVPGPKAPDAPPTPKDLPADPFGPPKE